MARQYVTTAIDYPNAAPHMGHVLEKVMADVIVRWFRLRGDDVRFQTGVDEHGVKIPRKAEELGMTPQQLVDQNSPQFQELWDELHISYDDFIRTTDQARHWPTVQTLWKKLADAGALEQRTYTGLYCAGCERFLTAKDLEDGKCPIHLKAPEEVSERNWFYLLSKRQADLQKLLTEKGGYAIVPGNRSAETLSLLDQGLEDVSFSRPRSSLAWGIPVPGDDEQVMYVWCDALTNYISTLDPFGLSGNSASAEWWDGAEVTHVIGKDIARFHALIWPGMLLDAGIKTPDQLFIHGFLTSEGHKMSKSLGNVVVPQEVIAKYGVDPLRFYLSHEVAPGNDGDFSWKRYAELYDNKLRNQLGNLLNRVLVMLNKKGGELPAIVQDSPLAEQVRGWWKAYAERMDALEYSVALADVAMNAVSVGNQLFNERAPWTEKDEQRQVAILAEFAELLRHVSLMLLPFVPHTAQKIAQQLGVPYAEQMLDRSLVLTDDLKAWGSQAEWKNVGTPEILFAPVE